MSDTKVQKQVDAVIKAYAHDLEGLTRQECRELTETPAQADALCSALKTGAGGEITQENRESLAAAGFSDEFIQGLAGEDGFHALHERVRWFGSKIFFEEGTGALHESLRLLQSGMSADVRRDKIDLILELGRIGPAGVPALIAALNDPSLDVRVRAAEALGDIGPAAVPMLLAALKRREEFFPNMVALALSFIGNPAVRGLVSAMTDEDELVRMWAVTALGGMKPAATEALLPLMAALRDSYPLVRSAAAQAIGEMGAEAADAVRELTRTLRRDKDSHVRAKAAEALGRIGPEAKAAVPALRAALGDKDQFVRSRSGEALVRIGPDAVPALVSELLKEAESSGSCSCTAVGSLSRGGGQRGLISSLLRFFGI